MATIFSTDGKINRGCVIRMSIDTAGGLGARFIPGELADNCVVVGFSTKREESVAIVKCFNDNNFIYAFGDNLEQSYLAVKAICFIGGDITQNTAFENVNAFYNQYRISQFTTKPLEFHYGGDTTILCYLMGLESNTADVKFLLQEVTFRLIMIPDKTGTGSGVGPIVDSILGSQNIPGSAAAKAGAKGKKPTYPLSQSDMSGGFVNSAEQYRRLGLNAGKLPSNTRTIPPARSTL